MPLMLACLLQTSAMILLFSEELAYGHNKESSKAFKFSIWSFVLDYTTEALTMDILLFVGFKTAKDLLKNAVFKPGPPWGESRKINV